MPDITKCMGESNKISCPIKDNCVRFLVSPDKLYQSYFTSVPYDPDKKTCNLFWQAQKDIKAGEK